MCGDFYTMALRIEQDKPRTLEQKRKCRWMNPTSPRQPPSSTSKIRSQAGQPMRTPSHPPPLKKWRGPWFSGRVRTHRVPLHSTLWLADSFEHTRRSIDERRDGDSQWRSDAYRNFLLNFAEQILQFELSRNLRVKCSVADTWKLEGMVEHSEVWSICRKQFGGWWDFWEMIE